MKPSIKAQSQFEKKGYEEVVQDTKRVSFESHSSAATLLEDGLGEEVRTQHVKRTPRWLWYTHAALFSISAALFVASWFGQPEEGAYTRKFSGWSPVLGAIRYDTVQYNFSQPSPYKGVGPEVDRAWNALGFDVGDQMISHKQMEKKMGKPMDSLGITNPKTGEHGYRIGIEVFHQLHCLNYLRKMTVLYHDYYEPLGGDLADPPEKRERHLQHCIEIIRSQLMCSSDVSVITYHDQPGKPGPQPDYNTVHVCRNYDAIRDWAIENTVATDKIGPA